MAGANDLFMNLNAVAAAAQGGNDAVGAALAMRCRWGAAQTAVAAGERGRNCSALLVHQLTEF